MNLQQKLNNPLELQKLIRLLLFSKEHNLRLEDVTPAGIGAVPSSGASSIAGVKTFTSLPVIPNTTPTSNGQIVSKGYLDVRLPVPPGSGNYHLISTDGTVSWAAV